MCSIFGAVGKSPSLAIVESIRERARDRGRDGGRVETFELVGGRSAILGNWRAAPTTELASGTLQPYDGLVHNGTIANDAALGARQGEIDSQVLARVLNRGNLGAFASSLQHVVGSYAVAVVNTQTVLAGVNYKPLFWWSPDGGENVYFSSLARHFDDVLPRGVRPVQVAPYTAIDFSSFEELRLPRQYNNRAIVIASAGLDSTVVASKMIADGFDVHLLHFRYGCRAETKEVRCLPNIAHKLGVGFTVLSLPYEQLAGSSSLLKAGAAISDSVAGAEYAHEWVPARNLVMLAHATAFAEANGFHTIALGNNLEEGGSYPDNEEQMTIAYADVLPYAVQNGYRVDVVSPLGTLMKHEIVKLGLALKAPLSETWSCYRAGLTHCGKCGPCFMRREAFERNNAIDPVFEGLGV